jgi:uncharacterized membrane protein YfcA
MMGQEILVLSIAVFGASVLQSATGIGFGIVAGPLLLIVLNDSAAIQVSVALNLLIAVILAPSLWRKSDRSLLRDLLLGLAVGSPIGLMIFLYTDVALLKIFAAVVVLFTLLLLLRGNRSDSASASVSTRKFEKVVVGFAAGMMGGILAMPGPVPAAWMSARGIDKDTIRATILVMFVVAYGFALLLQLTLAEISANTVRLTALLVPSTIVGIVVGKYLSKRISETVFRWILTTVLTFTIAILFVPLA